MAGAVTGAVGALFGVGLGPAIQSGDPGWLTATPIMSFLCFLVCGPLGWIMGGQGGPRIAGRFSDAPFFEIAVGIFAGLIPAGLVVWWGWRMMS